MAVRIFEINDSEWWVGDCTPEEILAAAMKETGCTREEVTGDEDGLPREISDEALDRLQFCVNEDRTNKISFRAQLAHLVESGQKFPCLFASTEF
jgi:hypothetical protein